jgi:hypothetical protein
VIGCETRGSGIYRLEVVSTNTKRESTEISADASILPGVTVGNIMAPSVVIGERAASMLQEESTAHIGRVG